ncbi:MAG: SusC/RagA family TonB-linked outer membrane protein [Fulvivirga sp.]|nr:SusC/RagA family TonB-linked outer membrane protein [Fulvivirga sp.]
MKKFLLLSFMLMFAFTFSESWAQERTVSGKVTSIENGEPLPGVNVVLKGTTTGTVTDIDGNYKLTVPSGGGTLVFSFIGLTTEEVEIGSRSVIDVQMSPDVEQLTEVIVTAQGIERKKEALGFAVSQVDEEEIAQRSEGDVARILRSKASGVNVTQASGVSGSATNVIIRGYSSVFGNNQPLYVVDGTPINTSTNAPGDFVDGNLSTSRMLDIDPNNIKEVSVLKGLAAANLYGTAGRNGVILITTKSGSKNKARSNVSVMQSYFVNEIASTPDYQDQFGNGFDQAFGWFFSNWGPSFDREGLGGWGRDDSFDENGTLPHPYSQFTNPDLRAAFPDLQDARYEWRPYDSFENFFRKGSVYNTSVNVGGSSADGKASYNVSYGYMDDQGFTEGNNLQRHNLSVGGSLETDNGFEFTSTMNFARTDFTSPPVAASFGNGAFGSGASVFGHVFFTPRSVDLMGLPFENPIDGSSVYYRNGNDIQNPRWTAKNAFVANLTNRVFGNAAVRYNINDNLNVYYRFSYDVFTTENENGQHKGGVEGNVVGNYSSWVDENNVWDHYAAINGGYEIGSNTSLSFSVGHNSRRTVLDRNGVSSTNQLVFGTFRHFNFQEQSPIQFLRERNIVGFFGQAEVDYNGYLFVTLAGRHDQVSNFAEDNRGIFYPSASVALTMTELFPGMQSGGTLNMLKVRGGFGSSASFGSSSYPIAQVLSIVSRDFIDQSTGEVLATNTTDTQLGNRNLKPELIQEIEAGIESQWLDNRLSLDVTLYKRFTTDAILPRPLDPATGYTSTVVNVGEIEAEGIEVDFNATVLETAGGLRWNLGGNFFSGREIVTDIGLEGSEPIAFAGFTNLGNFAKEGEQLGIMLADRIQRDDDGNFVVNSQGSYQVENGLFEIGNPNPDFTLNINNTLTYKNFTFDFLFNWVQGGDMYSSTVSVLLGRGLIEETVDRLNTFILPGVKADGTPNDIQINNSTYYFSNILFGPSELQVYDATTIRLQEVSLGYNLPKAILDKTPFSNVSIKASGYNLWYDAVNMPDGANFDPNVNGLGVGNGRGFDFINGPASRRYGVSLRVTL